MYSLAQAAAATGLNQSTILRSIKAGEISAIRDVHGQWVVDPAELRRYRRAMAMNYRTYFAHRIDMWDDDDENVVEHLAGVEDFEVAMATNRAACQRWPNAAITLRQGARVLLLMLEAAYADLVSPSASSAAP
jgi:Helix-turn-helix domain